MAVNDQRSVFSEKVPRIAGHFSTSNFLWTSTDILSELPGPCRFAVC